LCGKLPVVSDYVQCAVLLAASGVFTERGLALRSGRWTPEKHSPPAWWPTGHGGWLRWLRAFLPCTFAIGFLALAFFFVVLDETAGVESDAVVVAVLLSAGASILSALATVAVLLADRPRWIIPEPLRSSD
jgi:hypothetical protein